MSHQPAITVLLSVFNDAAYLPDCLSSVLHQSFADFELLAIDDGSTDGAGAMLDALADPRVRVIHNPQNLGLTRSLNLGIEQARGQFIARMDADDICHPDRLMKQYEFLQSNRDVGIVGCSRLVIDESGAMVRTAPAAIGNLAIRWKLLLGCPFAHPTVMLRKSVLDDYSLRYAPSFRTAQDYELWTRLLAHTRGQNLAEPLLSYRLRNGISKISKQDQLANHDRIAFAACQQFAPAAQLTPEDVRQLRGRFGGFSVRDPDMRPADPQWVAKYLSLLEAFELRHLDEPGIDAFAATERARISNSP